MRTAGSGLRDFCAEAEELLDALWDGIDLLEANADRPEALPPRLHALFRHAHSLKGLAGMSGLAEVAAAGHQLENTLDALRLGKTPWSPAVADWMRDACQRLRGEVRRLAAGSAPAALELPPLSPGASPARAAGAPAAGRTAPAGAGTVDPALRAVLSQYEETRLDFHLHRRSPLSAVRARWSLEQMNLGLRDLLGRLEPLGEVIATVPERTTPSGAEFLILFAGDAERARQACAHLAQVESLVAPSSAQALPPPEEDLGHTLRVDIERLDPILGRAGEITLEAGRLEKALVSLNEKLGPSYDRDGVLRAARSLARSIGQFRNGLLELRMIPMRRLAARLDRTVRDLSRRSGKRASFRCIGVDTEIDKHVADTLLAPLLHLVRNAVDHGLETPEERRAAGKAEEGIVTLEATPHGGSVTLRISDDGRGLEPARLLQAAERLGMEIGDDSRSVTDLIFEPGFSTRTQVSETSGRGVGLDEVRQRVRGLKGTLHVSSVRGQGCVFEMLVPATLAIVPAFLVRSGPALVALPLAAVLESRLVRGEDLRRLERNRLLPRGRGMMPVFRLGDLLGLEKGSDAPPERQPLLVARHPQGEVGLEVDALIGQREVMVRPLPGRLAGHPAVHGAAELEGDQVALMVDLGRLIEQGRTA